MNNVTVFYSGDCVAPTYESEQAAGCDLKSNIDIMIPAGTREVITTGLFIAIPIGFEGQIRPRSGLAYKYGITVTNSPGTCDSDFRGEIKVLLINHGHESFRVSKGDRIAQLVISPVMQAKFLKVDELPKSRRGENGFGSTGK